MQPCQQQDQEHLLQASSSWDSTDQLNCAATLDGSGNFLLEYLFPEVYDFNDDSIWGGELAGVHSSGIVPTTMEAFGGFQAGFHRVRGYEVNPYVFDGTQAGQPSTGTAMSPISSGLMSSAFPTPASAAASEQRSTKKRPPPEDTLSGRTTSPQSESSCDPTEQIVKRQRNTEAARRYRQRKVDRVTELEEALAAMTKERDDFKLKLARSDAEVDVLRRLVGKGS